MHYLSTRGLSPIRSFRGILLEGLAPDGGLYMPSKYPQLDLDDCRGMSYPRLAAQILSLFASDIPKSDVFRIVHDTYSAEVFGSAEITPVTMLDDKLGILELSNGPTLAFKDIALQLLGRLFEYELSATGRTMNVLGATSGDTGSAAIHALKGKRGVHVFMLSPKGRMSKFQQQQMYTVIDDTIFNLVVRGTFDDAQAAVKAVNADLAFKAEYNLGAINSINWARIAAQVVYYVYAYLKVTKNNTERVTFAVPSGNFGNALAAHVALMMGVPLDIIVCTNKNNILDVFFRTGLYRPRKVAYVTTSPSMDITTASNFERWVFDYMGGAAHADVVGCLWSELAAQGKFRIANVPGPGTKAFGIGSCCVKDDRELVAIHHLWEKYRRLIDPHTAVAAIGALNHLRDRDPTDTSKVIIVETAQPAKFADVINRVIGRDPPTPAGFENLGSLPERTFEIDPDPEEIKAFIRKHA